MLSYSLRKYSNPSVHLELLQYCNDLVIKMAEPCVPQKGGGRRGDIKEFSRASLRRMMLRLRNCKVAWTALITLTYPEEFPLDGRTVKKHLNAFCQRFRRGRKVHYYWVLEFQDRGAPHVHIICDDWVDIEACKLSWFNIVGSGDEKHRTQGVQVEAAKGDSLRLVGYLYSYLKKASQKIVPDGFQNVGRFWGGTRQVLEAMARIVIRCKERDARKTLRILRKWYESKNKEWQKNKRVAARLKGKPQPKWYKWKWRRCQGFTAWGGSALFDRLFAYDLNLKFGGTQNV